MLTKMNEMDMRKSNAGVYVCKYCGWGVWGIGEILYHQKTMHRCGNYRGQKRYSYYFLWRGPVYVYY